MRVPWTARRSNQLVLKEVNLKIHEKIFRGVVTNSGPKKKKL